MNVFFDKIKVKPHLSLIKLPWSFSHFDESFALFDYSSRWGQKWRVLVFITDTLLNLSVLINHSFKVSSWDTLRKLIFPADLSAKIVKPDTLLLQNVSTDACICVAVCMCMYVCVFLKPKEVFVCFFFRVCEATRNFIIFYLLKTWRTKSKCCPWSVYILHGKKILSDIWRLQFKGLFWV